MTKVGETFASKFGSASPSVKIDFKFGNTSDITWNVVSKEIGAGWFLNQYFYLFGPGLADLNKCIDHWNFLFEDEKERKVFGRNAYGALLIVEEPSTKGNIGSVGVLNPIDVSYFKDPNLVFMNFLGYWFPKMIIPNLYLPMVYEAWHKTTGDYLDINEILAIKTPISLGGSIDDANNFQIENIYNYYETTGKIYKEAFQKLK
ncbi:MAG: hypothetical protein MRY83_20135 [Flavobacteriales bacterium]|nr:hypothetical protein [Flavobacteriales bacterium]